MPARIDMPVKLAAPDSPVVGARTARDWKTILAVAAMLLTLVLFFQRTVFAGVPISRLGILMQADSLLNPAFTAPHTVSIYDPAVYQLAIPVQLLVERIWGSGEVPLWNPLNGCGYPLIGDLQSYVFSPWRALFRQSELYLYNLGLVFQDVLACAGIFSLGRFLGMSRWASAFGALAFAFCPYQLRYLELSNHTELYPWLILCLAWALRRPGLLRSCIAGAGSALAVASMHPECCFFAIVSGVLLAGLLAAGGDDLERAPLRKRLWQWLLAVAATGAIAICLSAPLLFPFIEYLCNSDSYKGLVALPNARPIDLRAIVLNLCQPGFGGASLFPGLVASMMLLPALCFAGRACRCLAAAVAMCLLFVCQPGPVQALFASGPLSLLLPSYCLPSLLVFLVLIAGQGVDVVRQRCAPGSRHAGLIAALVAGCGFATVSLPFVLNYLNLFPVGLYLDWGLPQLVLVSGRLAQDALVALVAAGLVVACAWRRLGWIIPACLIALNLSSQLPAAVQAVPAMPAAFEYSCPQPLPVVKDGGERALSVGVHCLLANTNQMYGFRDFRLYNPLLPDRYKDFVLASGGRLMNLYHYYWQHMMSPLLDLASVKYVISRNPVIADSELTYDAGAKVVDPDNPLFFATGIRLQQAQLRYAKDKAAVFGHLEWKVLGTAIRRYTGQVVLVQDDRVVWEDTQLLLGEVPVSGHLYKQDFSVPVPLRLQPGTTFSVGLRLFDQATRKPVIPPRSPLLVTDFSVVLGTYKVEAAPAVKSQFKLLSETRDGLRLYENLSALPQAYLVPDALPVRTPEEALETIARPDFDARRQAVIEGGTGPFSGGASAGQIASAGTVKITRPGTSAVRLKVSSPVPAVLVLTDTYYPGWTACIDGHSTEILRANFLFRAVCVPAGQHEVTFDYRPWSFFSGVGLSIAMASGLGIWIAFRMRRRWAGRSSAGGKSA